ncbi:MAG: hypothetical protein IPP71_09845 [Bacteroidetes bacterium]|nr:hypothetical protein [Bacteroidota bacterium]
MKNNLFDSNKSLVYCRIKGIDKIIWRKLLTNIHNRISINLKSGIQYKFDALVIDESKRSKISIPIKILNAVLKALNQLNRNLTNTVAEAKFNRLKLQNKIVGYAQQFIETQGKGVSIDLIISYLEKKNIVLTKSQLIHILNYNNDLIVYNSLKGWVLERMARSKKRSKTFRSCHYMPQRF